MLDHFPIMFWLRLFGSRRLNSKTHPKRPLRLFGEKYVHCDFLEKNKNTNVHPKRPWMCFSDKYYRRKVDSLLSRSIRDPAVVRGVLEIKVRMSSGALSDFDGDFQGT